MNRSVFVAALLLATPVIGHAQTPAQEPVLGSNLEKFSYAMGYRAARELMQQGIQKVDPGAFTAGIGEAMAGKQFRFSPEEIRAVMGAYQQEMIAERATEATQNQEKGAAFMQANASKEGVKAMAEGVQYKEITTGTGAKPAATDKVRVHYTGTLLDGTQFDSSHSRGEPTEFTVGDVIPGWQLALAQMPVGSRWTVWIAPEQAYGMRGAGASIGPNQTLVFDIELLEIVKPQ
jgi:FKBP-type peptidyl-prolyl cis-trans isomerase